MNRIDPVWAGVAELSRAFGARTLSPVDAVDALLDRIGFPRYAQAGQESDARLPGLRQGV